MSYGAIIGDVVGSIYEWNRIKTKDFDLFQDHCHYTDDSVCTAAVADVLLGNLPSVANVMRQWCRHHPDGGYGGYFEQWIHNDYMGPYGSFGNGSAMRISPVAFLNCSRPIQRVLEISDWITEISHNHPEGIKGARATTHAIWLAFQGEEPELIRKTIACEYQYDLSRSVDGIRPTYVFDETCQKTVPEAITCALESDSYEDAIRNAVSLGGDSDTLAAIAGSIAEALHGIPNDLIEKTKEFLPDDIIEVIERLYRTAGPFKVNSAFH